MTYVINGSSDVTKNIVSELFKILIVIAIFRTELFKGFSRITLTNSLQFALAPAAVYAIQNFSTEAGKKLLDGTTFNVINQCKLLSAAIFPYMMLSKEERKEFKVDTEDSILGQSIVQWLAIIICLGGTYFFLKDDPAEMKAEEDFLTGIMFTVLATILSGISTALMKRLYAVELPKINDGDTDKLTRKSMSYVSTAEMAIYQILIPMVLQVVMLCYHLYNNPDKAIPIDKNAIHFELWRLDSYIPFFTIHLNQWSLYSFLPCVLNALGGIFIGAMLAFNMNSEEKKDGGLERSKAFVIGMLVTAGLDAFFPLLGGKNLKFTFGKAVSGFVIIIAVLIHSYHSGYQKIITAYFK